LGDLAFCCVVEYRVGVMKNLTIATLVLTCFAPAQAGYAPLAEQCRADINLWVKGSTPTSNAALTVHALLDRSNEMYSCGSVLTGHESNDAAFAAAAFRALALERALNYIQRHGETKQFEQEDAAGSR
jgi:hypothetical protein